MIVFRKVIKVLEAKMEKDNEEKKGPNKKKEHPEKKLETTAATLAKAKEEVGLLLQEIRPTTIAGFKEKFKNTKEAAFLSLLTFELDKNPLG